MTKIFKNKDRGRDKDRDRDKVEDKCRAGNEEGEAGRKSKQGRGGAEV